MGLLKGLYSIGKMSVNAFILYKNQERRYNMWKFQLISHFGNEGTMKMHSDIFVFILKENEPLSQQKLTTNCHPEMLCKIIKALKSLLNNFHMYG